MTSHDHHGTGAEANGHTTHGHAGPHAASGQAGASAQKLKAAQPQVPDSEISTAALNDLSLGLARHAHTISVSPKVLMPYLRLDDHINESNEGAQRYADEQAGRASAQAHSAAQTAKTDGGTLHGSGGTIAVETLAPPTAAKPAVTASATGQASPAKPISLTQFLPR